MNTTANFSNLTWADIAHAGWQGRAIARKGNCAEVAFATPVGGEVRRLVSIDRLGRVLRAQLDTVAPIRRAVKMRIRIH